ncbi:MAG: protease complex subunit PrcB family protein [Sphingobacteriales bacterium]|nr:MAG: protease complex subunit PrcB family protein [Sphingobacteriales bacterium]
MKKRLITLLAGCIVTLVAFGCNSQNPKLNDPHSDENKTTSLEGGKLMADTKSINNSWTVIAEGGQCAMEEAGQIQITNEEVWKKTWTDAFNGIDPAPEIPEVDFSKNYVLAIFLGMVRTGGHTLNISSIEPDSDSTMVIVKHGKPGAGCMTTSAIEFPFLFVSVARYSPEVTKFTVQSEELPCN